MQRLLQSFLFFASKNFWRCFLRMIGFRYKRLESTFLLSCCTGIPNPLHINNVLREVERSFGNDRPFFEITVGS